MRDEEADVEMTCAEQVPEGIRVATPVRNDAQIDDKTWTKMTTTTRISRRGMV